MKRNGSQEQAFLFLLGVYTCVCVCVCVHVRLICSSIYLPFEILFKVYSQFLLLK